MGVDGASKGKQLPKGPGSRSEEAVPGALKTYYVPGMGWERGEFHSIPASPLGGLVIQPPLPVPVLILAPLHIKDSHLLGDNSCPACLVGLLSGSNRLAMKV